MSDGDAITDGAAASGAAAASDVQVAVLTSYTSDYELGALAAGVNRSYAAAHGYTFICRVCEALGSKWTTSSRAEHGKHPTWQKVHLIHDCLTALLRRRGGERSDGGGGGCSGRGCSELKSSHYDLNDDLLQSVPPPGTTHLLWIDADAAVICHERGVDEILSPLPASTELVIGEDLTPACLINAGVLLVRVSEPALRLKPSQDPRCMCDALGLPWQRGAQLLLRAAWVQSPPM